MSHEVRLLAGLLCLVMLLCAVLVGCTEAPDDSASSETSGHLPSGGESSGEGTSGETSQPEEDMYTHRTNVALRKPYTSPEANASYPDTYHKELTDGLTYNSDLGYMDPCFSDYTGLDVMEFVIDLEQTVERIYEFELSYYSDPSAGIGIPSSVRAFVSTDGETWDRVAFIRTEASKESGWCQSSSVLKKAVSARYVKFSMARTSANTFLDELSVYADVEAENTLGDIQAAIESAYAADRYDYASALKAIANGVTNTSLPMETVSVGTSYRVSRAAGTQHGDSNYKLTDGQATGATFESGHYVGFEGGDALDITLSLAKRGEKISRFEVSLYYNETLGAYKPAYIDVAVASGDDFVTVGRMYAPAAKGPCLTYVLSLPVTVSTDKVRFSVPEQQGVVLLLEEVAVARYAKEITTTFVNFYEEQPIPKTKPSYFPSSADDYNERQNLIYRLQQRIYSMAPLAKGTNGNTPESSGLLTDGKRANKADYTDPAYFKFASGEGREVVFDLGAIAAVDGYSLSFLRQDPVGINDMFGALFSLSEDGESWYDVSVGVLPSTQGTQFLRETYTLDRAYRARYVKFSFKVWPNNYCDELEVFGTKNASKASSLSESGEQAHRMQVGYAGRDQHTMNANDLVLLPNYADYLDKQGKETGYTEEKLLPYVAYLDESGRIIGRMFDGFMLLPSGSGKDGGHFYENATFAEVKAYYDKTLADGSDLDALEATVAKVNAALGENRSVTVYVGLAHPGKGVLFGDVDGDGQADTLDTLEKRIAAVRMQMEYFLQNWNAKERKNLVFGGFYWQAEFLNSDPEDVKMLRATAAYIHEKGLTFTWIPYFKSAGFDCWRYYGFDIACMQPNYMFNDMGIEYVDNCAIITNKLGMCVEMEFQQSVLTDDNYFNRYMGYLLGGVQHGYMTETVHFYYQEFYGYYNACHADDPKARLVYDYTHDFITGKLNTHPDRAEDASVKLDAGQISHGTVNADANGTAVYELVTSPQNGSLTLEADGSFTYYPYPGATGSDSFTFRVHNYLGASDSSTCTITIAG